MCPTSTGESSRAGARACAAGALAGALLLAACSDEVRQPIEYSHRLHVSELSLGCDHCHESSHLGDVAGLPALAVCAECHQEAIGTSAEERKVVAAVAAGHLHLPVHIAEAHDARTGIQLGIGLLVLRRHPGGPGADEHHENEDPAQSPLHISLLESY